VSSAPALIGLLELLDSFIFLFDFVLLHFLACRNRLELDLEGTVQTLVALLE
jgi:hypothetical protein